MTIRHGQTNKLNHPVSWNFGDIEGYQFAGTGDIRVQTYKSPLGTADRYFPSLQYVLVKPLTVNGKPVDHDGKPLAPGSELCVHSIPMISNFDEGECKQDKITYKWKYVPDLLDVHDFAGTPPSKLKLWLVNQPDGMDVHYWYGIKANPFLIDTWSQGHPTLPFFRSSGTPDYFSFNLDSGYDLALSLIRVQGDPVRYKAFHINHNDSSWYRRGCTLDVEGMKDGKSYIRTFAIYYDIEHKFYAFPVLARNKEITSAQELKEGTVAMKFVKTKAMVWPAPIDGNTIGKEAGVEQRPDWSFRHDGKRAVALPLIEDEPWSDSAITSKRYFNSGAVKELKEFYPMLVEIEFAIEITGDNLEDFTFDLSVVRYIDPQATGRAIISAQYAVKDFPDKEVKADDLIILEYEMYMNSMFIDTVEHWPVSMSYNVDYKVWNGNNYLGKRTGNAYYESDIFLDPTPCDVFLYYPSGKSLRRPNLMTIAKVKKLGSDSDEVLFSWVADYSSHQVDSLRQHRMRIPGYPDNFYGPPQYQFIDETKHGAWIDTSIKMDDWFTNDVPVGDPYLSEHKFCDFIYSANIQHIELSTLSFLILATVNASGNYCNYGYPRTTKKAKNESISGALQVFTVFGEEKSRQYAGYPALESQLETFYDNLFDVSEYKRFDLGGVISSKPGITNNDVFVNTFVDTDDSDLSTSTINFRINGCRKTFHQELTSNYEFKFIYGAIRPVIATCSNETTCSLGSSITNITNQHQVNFIKSMNQDITIKYGVGLGSALLEEKYDVYNCASILSNPLIMRKSDGSVDTLMFCQYKEDYLEHLFEGYNKDTDVIWSPKVFNFFEQSNNVIRPGFMHSRFVIDDTDHSFYTYFYQCKITETNLLGKTEFTDYPFGKIYFGKVYYSTLSMMNNIQSQIRTHPNGSYAVFSSNILAPKSKHSMSVLDETITSTSNSGTVEYDQILLDKIKIVYNYINRKTVNGVQTVALETYEKETTHIEMMNLAFKKEYTPDSYKFQISGVAASFGSTAPNTVDYSGGLKIVKKWDSPQLTNSDIFLNDQVYHDKLSGFDMAKVIAPHCFDQSAYPCTIKRYISEFGTYGSSFTYFIAPTHSLLIKSDLQFYISTPRMESIFYFNCPYIERDENASMLVPRTT